MENTIDMVSFLDYLDHYKLEANDDGFNKYLEFLDSLRNKSYNELSFYEKLQTIFLDYKFLNYAITKDELRKRIEEFKINTIDKKLLLLDLDENKDLSSYLNMLEEEYSKLSDITNIKDYLIHNETRPLIKILYSSLIYLINIRNYDLALRTIDKILELCPKDLLNVEMIKALVYLNLEDYNESFNLLSKVNKNDAKSFMLFSYYCFSIGDSDRSFSFLEKMDKCNPYLIYILGNKYLDILAFNKKDDYLIGSYDALKTLDLIEEEKRNEFVEFVSEQVCYFKVSEEVSDLERDFVNVIDSFYNEYGSDSSIDGKTLLSFARTGDTMACKKIASCTTQKIESIVDNLVKNRIMTEDGEFTYLKDILLSE